MARAVAQDGIERYEPSQATMQFTHSFEIGREMIRPFLDHQASPSRRSALVRANWLFWFQPALMDDPWGWPL